MKAHFLKLNSNQEIIEAIKSYCQNNNIISAWVSGIGALKKAEISFFDQEKNSYINKPFKNVELTSLSGNVAINSDNEWILHLHAVISDRSFRAFSGHLRSAIISVTGEILIYALDIKLVRRYDQKTGLFLIEN